jgi:hypothetical protein
MSKTSAKTHSLFVKKCKALKFLLLMFLIDFAYRIQIRRIAKSNMQTDYKNQGVVCIKICAARICDANFDLISAPEQVSISYVLRLHFCAVYDAVS